MLVIRVHSCLSPGVVRGQLLIIASTAVMSFLFFPPSFRIPPKLCFFWSNQSFAAYRRGRVTSNHSTSVWCAGRCLVTAAHQSRVLWSDCLHCAGDGDIRHCLSLCVSKKTPKNNNNNDDLKKKKESGEVSTCLSGWKWRSASLCVVMRLPEKKHDPDIEHRVTTAGRTRCCFPFYYITAVTSVLISREFFFISCW